MSPVFPGPGPSATVTAALAPAIAAAVSSMFIAVATARASSPSTLVAATANLVQALMKDMRRQVLHRCGGALGKFGVGRWGIRLAREGQRGAVTISDATYITRFGLL
jgi:hypothetical protein